MNWRMKMDAVQKKNFNWRWKIHTSLQNEGSVCLDVIYYRQKYFTLFPVFGSWNCRKMIFWEKSFTSLTVKWFTSENLVSYFPMSRRSPIPWPLLIPSFHVNNLSLPLHSHTHQFPSSLSKAFSKHQVLTL